MPKELNYVSNLTWFEKKKSIVSFENEKKQNIMIAVAPEFLGHNDIVTPEELFISSVAGCLFSYFLNVAEKMRLKFLKYESRATGTLAESGIDYIFTKVVINVEIEVANEKYASRARKAMQMAEEGCFVSNSIKSDVMISSVIKIDED